MPTASKFVSQKKPTMDRIQAVGLMLLLVSSLLITLGSSVNPRVTGSEPNYCSYMGGTKVYIYGEGFSTRENFGAPGDNRNLGNKVYLISNTETVECDVENAASTETMIVCNTRRMKSGAYHYVNVEVDGREIQVRRWFYPTSSRTPVIQSAYVNEDGVQFPMQNSFSSGSLITVKGRIYTQIYGGNNQTNTNGIATSITRAYLGGQTCELLKRPDELYGLRLTNTYTGELTCKPMTTYVGPQNFSLILGDDYGRSDTSRAVLKINGKDKIYTFQSFAEITNVSPAFGSLEGGTRVTIEGRNFDDTTDPIKIFIGRVPCEVIAGTITRGRVECIAGVAPNKRDYYPGSRGILVETWKDTRAPDDIAKNLNSSLPNYEGGMVIDSAAWRWNDTKHNFVGKFTGIFVAPKTDMYVFRASSYSASRSIYLDCDGTKQALKKYSSPSAGSQGLFLHEGQECYFESVMSYRYTTAWMKVGVHRSTSTFTAVQSSDSIMERQRIDVRVGYDLETQILNFTMPLNQTGVAEIQEIVVQHSCIDSGFCFGVGYHLGYEDTLTTFIQADASAMDIYNALVKIDALKDESISVSEKPTTGGIVYTVQFPSKRGDYSQITYSKMLNDDETLNITITETTKGISGGKTFKLQLGGRTTPILDAGLSSGDIKNALEATRVAICPDFLLPDDRQSDIVTNMDFEDTNAGFRGSVWGNYAKDVEPFCGLSSMVNNQRVFYSGRYIDNKGKRHVPFDATLYRWLCLAHRGIMGQYMYLYGKVKTEWKSWNVINPLHNLESQWKYSCIDLMELIQSYTPTVDQLTLYRVEFRTKHNFHNFYVDAVTIGSRKLTDGVQDVVRLRTPPALVSGIPISSVSVTPEGTQAFKVAITTYHCAQHLPLISMPGISSALSVHRTISGSPPISGYFDLTVNTENGQYNVTDIPVDIRPTDLKERLQSEIPGLGEVTVSLGDYCYLKQHFIDWATNGGNKALMEVHTTHIVGRNPITGNVVTRQDGGIYHNPITGDMLRLSYDKPQVEVFVNGYPSKCIGSCQFETLESATPIVSRVFPVSGSFQDNTTITIYGSNLETVGRTPSVVKIGDSDCQIISNSETSITCQVSLAPLGTYDVSVNVGGKGLARNAASNSTLLFTIQGSVSSIFPSSGSTSGGTFVTITGFGFSSNTSFMFGSLQCDIVTLNLTVVTCLTPEHSNGNISVVAVDGSEDIGTLQFAYLSSDAEVFSISPTKSTVNGGGNLTVKGVNIGGSGAVVYVGSRVCETLQSSSNEIICKLPSGPPGEYEVKVALEEKGFANGSYFVTYDLRVYDVFPLTGSINGGNEITVVGLGFLEGITVVKTGESICSIIAINDTHIRCLSGPSARVHYVTNNGSHQSYGAGYSWNSAFLEIENGDTVVWTWEFQSRGGAVARVFTATNAVSEDFDGVGFQSSPVGSPQGSFSYTFYNEGVYFISSGNVLNGIVMKQTIFVRALSTKSSTVNVTVGGYEAGYNRGNSSSISRTTLCGEISIKSNCTLKLLPFESDKFVMVTSDCYTPEISSISQNVGYKDSRIVIHGKGFSSSNCGNTITIGAGHLGEYSCKVISSTSYQLECDIVPNENTVPYTSYYFSVNVAGLGMSSFMNESDASRRFTLLPSISAISPSQGSLSGGSLLLISGSGFTSEMSVRIGYYYPCTIQNVTFFEIQCVTTAAPEGIYEITASRGDYVVECFDGSCEFLVTNESTPTITDVNPNVVVRQNTPIVINGTKLNGDVIVKIGSENCTVTSSSNTSIICTIAELPTGYHTIGVTVVGKGSASFVGTHASIYSRLTVVSMSPTNGSRYGGTRIQFHGNGFKSGNTRVMIGGFDCDIVPETLTNFEMECITEAAYLGFHSVRVLANGFTDTTKRYNYLASSTPEISAISPTHGVPGTILSVTGSRLAPEKMEIFIGDAACLNITGNDTQVKCEVGEHVGGMYPVSAFVEPFGNAFSSVSFSYTYSVSTVTPSKGSFAGGNLLTIYGMGFSNASVITVCGSLCRHGQDIDGTSVAYNNITCLLSEFVGNTSADQLCDITATVNGQAISGKGLYTFATDHTPRTTAISPQRGGTMGGTEVTINGVLFGSNPTNVNVEIGGAVCDVSSCTDTEIKCITNARGKSSLADIKVTVTGKGVALNNGVQFYYIDVWSSPFTWGGQLPPIEGDFIVVPKNQTLLIDQDTPVLKMLLINGGTVLFDEKDIHLQTENILITDGGLLQVGTESEPFQHEAIITLHGHLKSQELPIYGTKAIGVRNGTLDLHGKRIPRTWAHLGQTASAGSNTISLRHPVTWKAGDEIVIASTGDRRSYTENEKHTIVSVSSDKMVLTLNNSLIYKHISSSEMFGELELETRGEVGLLTRNIVVQGTTTAYWTEGSLPRCEDGNYAGDYLRQDCFQGRFGEEAGSDQFGGHIMVHHRTPGLDIARARLEYVELRNMGQAFHLGRHPINFHRLGDVHYNNYVRGCAIHKSFNRAVMIHDTDHLLIEHNVLYDIMGGAVFIKGGIEHGNKFEHNLVVFCKQSTSLEKEDIAPAAFWISNPNNTFQHNAVAGGTHYGFWYYLRDSRYGSSAKSICQEHHPLGKFSDNTVHSQGWFGLWISHVYDPQIKGYCVNHRPGIARFDSLTVWNCETGVALEDIGAVQLHNFLLVHNERRGVEVKYISNPNMEWGDVGIYNCTVIAHTTELSEGTTYRGLILPMSRRFEMVNITFINFDKVNSAAMSMSSVPHTCTHRCGGWDVRSSGITFNNSPRKMLFRWEHEVVLNDMDGTLSGNPNAYVLPYNPTLPSHCSTMEGFDLGHPHGVECVGLKLHRVWWYNVSPYQLRGNVILSNDWGNSSIPYQYRPQWTATVVSGQTYKWTFVNDANLTNMSYNAVFYNFKDKDCVIVSHTFEQEPDEISINGQRDSVQNSTLSCEKNVHGDYYFDKESLTLYYLVSGRGLDVTVDRAMSLIVRKKYSPPPPVECTSASLARPSDYRLWHDSSFWKRSEGEYVASYNGDGLTSVPPNGQDIRIEAGTWMVVREQLPTMNKLWIEGVLEIEPTDPNLNVTLSATHIVILGGRLIIGLEDSPFRGVATIILRGNPNTPDIVGFGRNMGSKVIGVIGGLDIHGQRRSSQLTHLARNLKRGESTIIVENDPSGWVTGDDVVIASTSADPWETETFRIVSVNGSTITLNDSARFDHIAESFNVSIMGKAPSSYDIRAEVGLLTRNIKVIGENDNSVSQSSFGARILIGTADASGGYICSSGSARISNVEFYRTGQLSSNDDHDPKCSITFLNTGKVDASKSSFVRQSTFHNGFNTAIGVFGASFLPVNGNVIHNTFGPGIRVAGTNNSVENNLVMLSRMRRFDRWEAAIEVNSGNNVTLKNNVVIGSERAGYRIDGHDCNSFVAQAETGWNTARATLQGVYMKGDGFRVCTQISKFRIHNAYDYGIYYQGVGSLIISDVLVTDSGFAFAPMVYSPRSVYHAFEDKSVRIENSTIVAVSSPGYCPTMPDAVGFIQNSRLARGYMRDGATRLARTGILWPSFVSCENNAPRAPFVRSTSYPAIGGRTELYGLAFVNFDDTTCTADNTVIMTNLQVEDFLHPIYTSRLEFINSSESRGVYFHRPSLGSITPSNCVDMECDGMKKALLVDRDGSMVGKSGGSIIPEAEYEWGGDIRRGLGDYRIPKALLTNQDGSIIDVNDVAPNKGILRANTSTATCTMKNEWQAYKCTGYHHGILVIESLDIDSETRRLSPVALLANQYIDLNNGPQDHGWCNGLSCRERLSTFWAIVAFDNVYELYFSATSPEKLRLRILNEDSSSKMVLKIFSKRPQRLDVHTNGIYTLPLNGRYDENGKNIVLEPTAPGQYVPTASDVAGANYFDRLRQTFYVTLGGGSVVEIHEADVVVITFNMPAVSPDEFFDNGRLVTNLALFLNVSPRRIRIVNAVRETISGRMKRSVEAYSATLEIGNTVEDTMNASSSDTNSTSDNSTLLSYEDLVNLTATVTNALQERTLSEALGTEVSTLTVVDARSNITRNVNITNTTDTDESVVFAVPYSLKIIQQPTVGVKNSPLSPVLKVAGLDASGNEIILGHSSDPWQATASIVSSTQSNSYAYGASAYFNNEDGRAEFTDLAISQGGDYILMISITYPSSQSHLAVNTTTIQIAVDDVTSVANNNIPLIVACSVLGGVLAVVIVALVVMKGLSASNSVSSWQGREKVYENPHANPREIPFDHSLETRTHRLG